MAQQSELIFLKNIQVDIYLDLFCFLIKYYCSFRYKHFEIVENSFYPTLANRKLAEIISLLLRFDIWK